MTTQRNYGTQSGFTETQTLRLTRDNREWLDRQSKLTGLSLNRLINSMIEEWRRTGNIRVETHVYPDNEATRRTTL